VDGDKVNEIAIDSVIVILFIKAVVPFNPPSE